MIKPRAWLGRVCGGGSGCGPGLGSANGPRLVEVPGPSPERGQVVVGGVRGLREWFGVLGSCPSRGVCVWWGRGREVLQG